MTDQLVFPAMDAESWVRDFAFKPSSCGEVGDDMVCVTPNGETWVIKARHAHAAIALHGQPFGFTREDVRNLRDAQLWADSTQLTSGGKPVDFESLADRIEALLPPETPNGK